MSLVLLTGALLPLSESAAGGNYNLRYLSAAARRDITQFPAIRPSSTQAAPHFSLDQGKAYTLYVPGAGFLWSDLAVWRHRLLPALPNGTGHHDDGMGNQWSTDGSHRVFFQDKFAARYPWEIHRVPRPFQKRNSPRTIHSGSTVRLYDSIGTRYLCVIPGERVVSEADYSSMDESLEQITKRIRVG